MPTVSDFEVSDYLGEPVAGVRFIVSLDQYAYSLGDLAFDYQDVEYVPLAGITVSNVTQDANEQMSDVKVEGPFNNEVTARFLAAVSPETYVVEIYSTHYGASDADRIFKGLVIGVDVEGRYSTLTCASEMSLLKTMGLRRTFSRRCSNQLFEPDSCGVDPTTFTHTASVAGVMGVTVDVGRAGEFDDGYFDSGTFKRSSTGEWRTIMKHVGTTLTLMAPFNNLQAGEDIIIRAGCDHKIATCHEKFNNKRRCQCWANVPAINPVTTRLT